MKTEPLAFDLTDQEVNDEYRKAMAEGNYELAARYANEANRRGMIL